MDIGIEVSGLTKRYGDRTAVDDLSFTVRPGVVTGFLGPNGAGKSTTMRMILGLDRPTSGTALIGGRRMTELRSPMQTVGALLDARALHPGRTAFDHLLALARTGGLGRGRVRDVLGLVGLSEVADQRVARFSLGMHQRLGIATALLGDPAVLILDEPVNGLDPEGIRWVREMMRQLAGEGRAVLFSSHLMREMELTAEHLVVIGQGRLVADMGLDDFVQSHAKRRLLIRTRQVSALAAGLAGPGVTVELSPPSGMLVEGLSGRQTGMVAARLGVELEELTAVQDSLEDVFLKLTSGSVEYAGRAA